MEGACENGYHNTNGLTKTMDNPTKTNSLTCWTTDCGDEQVEKVLKIFIMFLFHIV